MFVHLLLQEEGVQKITTELNRLDSLESIDRVARSPVHRVESETDSHTLSRVQ